MRHMMFHPHQHSNHHFDVLWLLVIVLFVILVSILSVLHPLPSFQPVGTDWLNGRYTPSFPGWP